MTAIGTRTSSAARPRTGWDAKCRLPDGRQIQKKLGPARAGRGRPANGYFTKRLAEDWLRSVLEEARRGTLPVTNPVRGHVRRPPRNSSATPPRSAAASRRRCATTGPTSRRTCCPRSAIRLSSRSRRRRSKRGGHRSPRLRRAPRTSGWSCCTASFAGPNTSGTAHEPGRRGRAATSTSSPPRRCSRSSVRQPPSIDAAIFLIAVFTGLRRGELLALRWRDVDVGGCTVRVRSSYVGRPAHHPQVRQRPFSPPGARRFRGARATRTASRLGRR